MDVIVERGVKRVVASAAEWPGLSRRGRDEDDALALVLAYAPRYERIFARHGFVVPADRASLRVVERVQGNTDTDRGWPAVTAKADAAAASPADVERFSALFETSFKAFDAAVARAKGKTLAKGPRGGGRALRAIVDHVREGQLMYLGGIGAPHKPAGPGAERAAVLAGLAASARGEFPARGPRGGVRWKPRYFVRRSLWHILDHIWEIEDRIS